MNRFLHFLTVDPPPLSQQTYHPNPATHVQAYTATTDETELKWQINYITKVMRKIMAKLIKKRFSLESEC